MVDEDRLSQKRLLSGQQLHPQPIKFCHVERQLGLPFIVSLSNCALSTLSCYWMHDYLDTESKYYCKRKTLTM